MRPWADRDRGPDRWLQWRLQAGERAIVGRYTDQLAALVVR
jgi:hypothetical protein